MGEDFPHGRYFHWGGISLEENCPWKEFSTKKFRIFSI